jgi:hypothetical protein
MSNQPEAAWVEAARIAASELCESFAAMGDYNLELPPITENPASQVNSEDTQFFQKLVNGDYFNENFLAYAE